jgi:hypothetical protein
MIDKQIPYSTREYDSRVTTNDVVKRAYFDPKSHDAAMTAFKNQINDMLPWITEHMVLPTVEGQAIHEWALSTTLTDNAQGVQLPAMPTRTRIPKPWVKNISDPKHVYTNPRTGDARHTKPCPLGVLGGLAGNLRTQRELTQPQITALNILFRSMSGPVYDYLFPDNWVRYDFVLVESHGKTGTDKLADIFGV